jgi:hypothetical protein
MFRWYQQAQVCYAYIADFSSASDSDLASSRWFIRGWTLQELLAPKSVVFLDSEWRNIGTKVTLMSVVEEATGIQQEALEGKSFESFSVAQRL